MIPTQGRRVPPIDPQQQDLEDIRIKFGYYLSELTTEELLEDFYNGSYLDFEPTY